MKCMKMKVPDDVSAVMKMVPTDAQKKDLGTSKSYTLTKPGIDTSRIFLVGRGE